MLLILLHLYATKASDSQRRQIEWEAIPLNNVHGVDSQISACHLTRARPPALLLGTGYCVIDRNLGNI